MTVVSEVMNDIIMLYYFITLHYAFTFPLSRVTNTLWNDM